MAGDMFGFLTNLRSCHKAMADDAVDASKVNVNAGGKLPLMRETIWAGRPQSIFFTRGVAKGIYEEGASGEGDQHRVIEWRRNVNHPRKP